MTARTSWTIAIGQWFFRFRNAVFPIFFLLVALLLRPRVLFGRPDVDRWLIIAGAAVALAGQAIRLLTIGYEYIERGGKNKQVWASRLVQGGIYGHTRNPMYVGNLMIAIGMCMATGAPGAYLVVIPLFVFIYQAIMVAEETYLRRKFGAEYEAYCRRVPRLVPTLKGWRKTVAAGRYDWRRAVRKDLSTITGLLLGLSCLPLWRAFFLWGPEAARALAPRTLALAAAVLGGFWFLHLLKKRRIFLYVPSELSEAAR